MRAIGQRYGALCRFIQQYTQTHGWPPSRREMGAALECPSTGLVAYYLETLEQQGYVSRQPAISRGLVLTPAGLALAEQTRAAGPDQRRRGYMPAERKPQPRATREPSRQQAHRETLAALGRQGRHA